MLTESFIHQQQERDVFSIYKESKTYKEIRKKNQFEHFRLEGQNITVKNNNNKRVTMMVVGCG